MEKKIIEKKKNSLLDKKDDVEKEIKKNILKDNFIDNEIEQQILKKNNLSTLIVNEGNVFIMKGDNSNSTNLEDGSTLTKCYNGFFNLTQLNLTLNESGNLSISFYSGKEPSVNNYFNNTNGSNSYSTTSSGSSSPFAALANLGYKHNIGDNKILIGYSSDIIPKCKKHCSSGFKHFGKENVFTTSGFNLGATRKINNFTLSSQYNANFDDILCDKNGSNVENKGLFGEETQSNNIISLAYTKEQECDDSELYGCINLERYKSGTKNILDIPSDSLKTRNDAEKARAAFIAKTIADAGYQNTSAVNAQEALFKAGTREEALTYLENLAIDRETILTNLLINKNNSVYSFDSDKLCGNYTAKVYTELNDSSKNNKNIYFSTLIAGYKKKCGIDTNLTYTTNSDNTIKSYNLSISNYLNIRSLGKCSDNKKQSCYIGNANLTIGTPLFVSSGSNKDTKIPIVGELSYCASIFGFNIPLFIDRVINVDGTENVNGWVFGISPQSIALSGKTPILTLSTNNCCDKN